MPRLAKPKGKMYKGSEYVSGDEEYDKKTRKKEDKSMKTAGLEKLFMKSEKNEGYSNKPRVKGAAKAKGFVSGQKKVK